jgi:hypothetical protein
VSPSFAVKLADRVSRTGSAEPARQGRPSGCGKLAPYLTALLEWVEAEPDITMPELAEHHTVKFCCPTVACRMHTARPVGSPNSSSHK